MHFPKSKGQTSGCQETQRQSACFLDHTYNEMHHHHTQRLSRPWISGWYFQAWEAPVRRISPCNEGHLARRQKYGPRMVVSAQRAPGRSEAATAPRTCGNWRTDMSHKEAFVYTVFTGAAGIWKGMGLDYKTFLPLCKKKKNRHASGNMKPAFRLVIWTFTMALVCIPSSAYPLIAFREGEEELQKDLSF